MVKRDVLPRVETVQAGVGYQGTSSGGLSLRSLCSASSVSSGVKCWPFGPLGLRLQMGPA